MQIGKISPVVVSNRKNTSSLNSQKTAVTNSVSSNEYMNKNTANAIKANVSFGVNFVDNSVPPRGIEIGNVEKQLSMNVLLNGKGRIADNEKYFYSEQIGDKEHNFLVRSIKEGDKRSISIVQDDKTVLEGFIKDGLSDKIKIEFKTAKHKPEAKITLEDGTTIQLLEGSRIQDRQKGLFAFQNPGKYTVLEGGQRTTKQVTPLADAGLSFTGNVVSLLCKKDATVNATNDSKDLSFITSGVYHDVVKKDDPTFAVLAGGFGTRFGNMTTGLQNKPSFVMPNGYSILSSAYDLIKNASAADKLGSVTYLEQNGKGNPPADHSLIALEDDIIPMPAFQSDGGAIIRAVQNGDIPDDKPLVILNADTITNVDISQVYNKLKTLKNAAMVIPSYPVSETRAKSFGLMAAGQRVDKQGSHTLTSFVEKPENPSIDATSAMIDGKQVDGQQAYNGNPGIYVFNKEVLQNIDLVLETAQEKARKEDKPIPTELKDPYSSSTFLGNAFVPAVVRLCQEGKLTNDEGAEMNTYMVPMLTSTEQEAYWDDIGAAEAFVHVCQDIAFETRANGTGAKNKFHGVRGIQDFYDSVDLLRGSVYASPKDRQNYENKHSHKFAIMGDAYITCK